MSNAKKDKEIDLARTYENFLEKHTNFSIRITAGRPHSFDGKTISSRYEYELRRTIPYIATHLQKYYVFIGCALSVR